MSLISTKKNKQIFSAISISLLGMFVVYALVYYPEWLPSRLTLPLAGDSYDTVLNGSIMQHWYNVFRGLEQWNETQYFAGHTDTLGYNDGYFLLGIPCALLRFLGVVPFYAKDLACAFTLSIGFLAFYTFTRLTFQTAKIPSILGGILFSTFTSLTLHNLGHSQLLTLSYVPYVVLCLHKTFIDQRILYKQRLIWLSAFSILYGAMLLTGFYIAFFFTLWCACYTLCFLLIFTIKNGKSACYTKVKILFLPFLKYKSLLLAAFTFPLLAVIPFLMVYLPKLHETGGQKFYNAWFYIPRITSIFRLPDNNLLYGHVSLFTFPIKDWEWIIGFTPGIWISLICFLFYSLSLKNNRNYPVYLSYIATVFLIILLTTRIGFVAPWWIIFKTIPGAHGIRTVSRFLLFASFPIAICLTCFLDRLYALKSKKIFALALGIFLITEQLNYWEPSNLPSRMLEAQKQITLPPSKCQSFLIVGDPNNSIFPMPKEKNPYEVNVLAMHLAEIFALPTIEGYSTFTPQDWNFEMPYGESAIKRAKDYSDHHPMAKPLCAFDQKNRSWSIIQ